MSFQYPFSFFCKQKGFKRTFFTGIPTPNYAIIYKFLASLFDPNEKDHTKKLNEMAPVDKTAAQMLMHNLAINLTNRTFMESHDSLIAHRRLYESAREQSSNLSPTVTDNNDTNNTILLSSSEKESMRNFSDPFFLLENVDHNDQ